MSVSGIGSGSNSSYDYWAELLKTRAAQRQAATAGATSTPGSGFAQVIGETQTTTGASGASATGRGASDAFAGALDALGSALESGDVAAAQDALKQLAQAAPKPGHHGHHGHHGVKEGADTPATARGRDPIRQAFDAIGSALDGGDLAAAQSAFANLKDLLAQGPAQGTPPGTGPAVGVKVDVTA